VPTNTYTSIATITLTSSDSEVVFSSIPATYRDLILVISGKTTADTVWGLRFNSDSGSNYSFVRMYGTGSSTVSDSNSANNSAYIETGLSSDQSHWVMQLMDYSATDKHKTYLSRNSQSIVSAYAGRWANTSAVTSISTYLESATTWAAGTTFSLYGVIS
jgi:hypothetical protein